MKIPVVKGATSVTLLIFIQDSSSTTGAGLTGLAYNSAGLTCYRARDDDGNAGATAISLVTATRGTWASGGFVEKDATNMPGWYLLSLPNNALATGSRTVGIHLKGATNMAPLPIEVLLTGVDDQDAVRGGMTALPNAAAAASGGLFTRGTGAGQINQAANGQIDVNVVGMANDTITSGAVASSAVTELQSGLATSSALATVAGYIDTEITDIQNRLPAALVSGRMDASIGAAAANTITASALATDAVTEIQAGLATSAALAVVDGIVDDILVDTAEIGAAGAGLTALASAANLATLTGYVDTEVAAIKAKTDNLPASPAAVSDIPTAAAVADAVWDETLSGHAGVGSTGAALAAAGGSGDPWATALPGAYGAGTAGQILGDYLDVAVSSVSGGGGPSASDIADEVETRTIAGVTTVGTVNALAANSVNASALASDAVAEIQSGLATAAALATVDTVVDGIAADVGALPSADDIWDEAVEGSVTARQSLRLSNAALGGKASGLETTAVAFRDLADTKDRITATVDASGNRTAVSRDLT